MIRPTLISTAALVALASPLTTTQAAPRPDGHSTILVLDGSGSMWAQLPEGRSRIEVARDVLGDYLDTRDASVPLGVIAYGHNRRGDCSDIATIAPVAEQQAATLGPVLRGLMPRGKTPLAEALRRAAAELPATAEAADIVLITDGLETCGGDPCAVAAELAAQGVPVRAHVVGLGLTEGEIRQIACVAEQTGGMVLATQSGTELAEALQRTTQAAPPPPQAPGRAALNLGLLTDAAGRPDRVTFLARDPKTGETLTLGILDYAESWVLPVDLPAGDWEVLAEAGDQGQGSLAVQVETGTQSTIHVPFTGRLPSMRMDQLGPYRAGASGLFPLRITRQGLAQGGADFVLTLLPPDAATLEDRPLTWSMQSGGAGAYLGQLNLPATPGRYRVAWHRYGETDLSRALAGFEIEIRDRPAVDLAAPAAVAPGAPVPVSVRGGGAHDDRVELWRDGAPVSWDHSLYLAQLFDSDLDPARVLTAPETPGAYEIVYLFAGLDGETAVAARLPLTVGEADPGDQDTAQPPAPKADTGDGTEAAADRQTDIGHACPADHGVPCLIDDLQTGLLLTLPPGWVSDLPTRAAATAGDPSQDGPVRVSFFSPARPEPDTVVLNPHQWTTMNGPCETVQAGELCWFAPGSPALDPGLEVFRRGLYDRRPTATPQDGAAQHGAEQDGHGPDQGGAGERAFSDYPHRCLPGDRSTEHCEMRDAATQLFFRLPETWVAETLSPGPAPQAAFHEAGPGANHIALNPVDWSGPGCAPTRAGLLCANPAIDDPALRSAYDTLRFTLTTGEVLRRCGDAPCTFAHPNPALSGTLPALWSVEVGRRLADGRVATWLWNRDRSGRHDLLGLNQPGGQDCLELQPGDSLCSFTPGIPEPDLALIATMLVPPSPADRRPADGASPLAADRLQALTQMLERP